jgi:hypothetical protein
MASRRDSIDVHEAPPSAGAVERVERRVRSPASAASGPSERRVRGAKLPPGEIAASRPSPRRRRSPGRVLHHLIVVRQHARSRRAALRRKPVFLSTIAVPRIAIPPANRGAGFARYTRFSIPAPLDSHIPTTLGNVYYACITLKQKF